VDLGTQRTIWLIALALSVATFLIGAAIATISALVGNSGFMTLGLIFVVLAIANGALDIVSLRRIRRQSTREPAQL
jgi:uncharacterized membrane protein